MTATRYRKRPVEVDTIQWTGDNEHEVVAFTGPTNFHSLDEIDRGNSNDPDATAAVYDCLHSTWVLVYTGQHIVRGVKGEYYPIAEDVLAETYEPAEAPADGLTLLLEEVRAERARQDQHWGEQNHRDGTGPTVELLPGWPTRDLADAAQNICQRYADMGIVSWRDIFGEEVCEALAESDPARLRAELVQAVSVGVAWIEAIDRRSRQEQPS
ncbi:hypothetical protein [Streptomyces justiciae]|uniref:Uncharacterized protein n=1 Tax=Streptomyces justiciae TaxID=2780140 RepID=A0ABU3M7B3_9ACTN|nr:hypothetical protein [Streptomyces justiciae]MDT7847238.1 hypothetical protein [Streptomyces justiciae]